MNKKALVHCITNYVAMDFTANSLLAVGATPLMSFFPDEMEDIVSKCDALLVNLGCLDNLQIDAMKIAVKAAGKYGKPWVLDPVGADVTNVRYQTCVLLMEINPPAVIKGNQREITALRTLLENYTGIVIQTGKTDLITYGERKAEVHFGSEMMDLVTAMGCSAGAVVASYISNAEDAFQASVDAMTLFGRAGENAAKKSNGTGTFKMEFIDELCRLSEIIPCN